MAEIQQLDGDLRQSGRKMSCVSRQGRKLGKRTETIYVRYWPKADMRAR